MYFEISGVSKVPPNPQGKVSSCWGKRSSREKGKRREREGEGERGRGRWQREDYERKRKGNKGGKLRKKGGRRDFLPH